MLPTVIVQEQVPFVPLLCAMLVSRLGDGELALSWYCVPMAPASPQPTVIDPDGFQVVVTVSAPVDAKAIMTNRFS